MDFPLYFQKRIFLCHHFKIKPEGWNFQDLLILMQTITGSFCGIIGFFKKLSPHLKSAVCCSVWLNPAVHCRSEQWSLVQSSSTAPLQEYIINKRSLVYQFQYEKMHYSVIKKKSSFEPDLPCILITIN